MSRRMSPETRTVTILAAIVVTMGALAWTAVPFYNWFCRVTGYGGTTQVAQQTSDEVLDESSAFASTRISIRTLIGPSVRCRPAWI